MQTTASEGGLPYGIIWWGCCWNIIPGDAFNVRIAKYLGKKSWWRAKIYTPYSECCYCRRRWTKKCLLWRIAICSLVCFCLTFTFTPCLSKQVMFLLVPAVAVEDEFNHDYLFNLFREHGCRPAHGKLNPRWEWSSDFSIYSLWRAALGSLAPSGLCKVYRVSRLHNWLLSIQTGMQISYASPGTMQSKH